MNNSNYQPRNQEGQFCGSAIGFDEDLAAVHDILEATTEAPAYREPELGVIANLFQAWDAYYFASRQYA